MYSNKVLLYELLDCYDGNNSEYNAWTYNAEELATGNSE